MPGVNCHYPHTRFLSFIAKKSSKLGKRPAMQTPSAFPTALFGCLSNFTQFFNHNSSARGTRLDDAFTENVITVPSKPLHFTSQFFKLIFGRLCAFGLQGTLNPEITAVKALPLPFTKKLSLG